MDGSVLAVPAASSSYQNNLVSSKNDDVLRGSMFTTPMSGKVDFCSKRDKIIRPFQDHFGNKKLLKLIIEINLLK